MIVEKCKEQKLDRPGKWANTVTVVSKPMIGGHYRYHITFDEHWLEPAVMYVEKPSGLVEDVEWKDISWRVRDAVKARVWDVGP